VKLVVGDVIYRIDLTCPAGDRGETTWQRFNCDCDQMRLSTSAVAYHLVIFVPDVLNSVGADGPLT
jgi:hypothetical protein